MDLKIKGKNALVMGASTGIGYGIAQSLIEEGVKVAICARSEDRLIAAASKLGASLSVPCDLSKKGSALALVKTVQNELGGLDILVINTGGPPKGDFSEITTAQWELGFQDLWMSTVDSIQAVLPGMKERRWGRILLVTSVAAQEAMPHLTISNGLRAGLLGLTKSLSNEIASFGISINAVLPGFTRTERLRDLGLKEETMTPLIPARRLGEVEELAALSTFLLSDRAGYVTGQAIACDGGYLRSI